MDIYGESRNNDDAMNYTQHDLGEGDELANDAPVDNED